MEIFASPIILLILFVISLVLSGFFSFLQAACTSLSSHKVSNFFAKNTKYYTLLDILSKPQKLILSLFVGHQLFSVAAVVLATVLTIQFITTTQPQLSLISFVILTLVISLWMVVFSDMLPKAFASKHPERIALIFSKPILFIIWILTPFVLIFELIMHNVAKFSGKMFLDANQILTADEIKNLITIGEKDGVIESVEREMIDSIFEFSLTIVREIMTPRTDITAIAVTATVGDTIKLIQSQGNSRIPVFEGSADNVIGVIYAKDLLGISDHSTAIKLFLRDVSFVPETQNIVDLLHQMKKNKMHLAIVVDEYGGISGLVTMEDIIEEIIGEIQDEYDRDERPDFIEINPGHYVVDAGMNINDLGVRLGTEFPDSEDFDTIGGLVLSLLGRFPSPGQVVPYNQLQIKVKEISKRRILSVEIYVMDTEETGH